MGRRRSPARSGPMRRTVMGLLSASKVRSFLPLAHGTGKFSDNALEQAICVLFDLTPDGMIRTLGLDKPIFRQFCNYGHFTHEQAPWEQTNMAEPLECACRAKEAGVSQR